MNYRYHFDTLHEAYDHLVRCRKIAAPNFGFFLQLIRYEKELEHSKEINSNNMTIKPIYNALTQPATENNSIDLNK